MPIRRGNLARVLVYGGLAGVLLLYFFGRPLWHPLYLNLRGDYSLSDVYEKLGQRAEDRLRAEFQKAGLEFPGTRITFVALKEERILELWASDGTAFHRVKAYPFTGFSGKLGPKLKAGDRQIPEGLYGVSFLNPNSNFHLSIQIDYPNQFDRQKAIEDGRTDLGGDIFLHGKTASIGCIPVGDRAIEELFTLVYLAGLDKVQVLIAPYDMRISTRPLPDLGIPWLPEAYENIRTELLQYRSNTSK